jgi:hypothetical protein
MEVGFGDGICDKIKDQATGIKSRPMIGQRPCAVRLPRYQPSPSQKEAKKLGRSRGEFSTLAVFLQADGRGN